MIQPCENNMQLSEYNSQIPTWKIQNVDKGTEYSVGCVSKAPDIMCQHSVLLLGIITVVFMTLYSLFYPRKFDNRICFSFILLCCFWS